MLCIIIHMYLSVHTLLKHVILAVIQLHTDYNFAY